MKIDSPKKAGTPTACASRGSRLKARREELGLTQDELSHRTAIHVKLLSRYENNRSWPRRDNRQELFKALGLNWSDDGEPRPDDSTEMKSQGQSKKNDGAHSKCNVCSEVARLAGVDELEMRGVLKREDNSVLSVARTQKDRRLVGVRTSVVELTMDDARSLHALAEQIEEQIRRSGK